MNQGLSFGAELLTGFVEERSFLDDAQGFVECVPEIERNQVSVFLNFEYFYFYRRRPKTESLTKSGIIVIRYKVY